ncbi:MAG: AAA family ATPase [Dehalococcoidales bacterium]
MIIVALVGMTGAGKSEAAHFFTEMGFAKIRFGDITDQEIQRRGLILNEENERAVREGFRKEHGMAAYAILNLPRIEQARKTSPVIIDGLYSWEEYKILKDYFGADFSVAAVYASPQTRYQRLEIRQVRPLTSAEAAGRDEAEITNINKGGPIAIADYTIVNEGTIADLEEEVQKAFAFLTEAK